MPCGNTRKIKLFDTTKFDLLFLKEENEALHNYTNRLDSELEQLEHENRKQSEKIHTLQEQNEILQSKTVQLERENKILQQDKFVMSTLLDTLILEPFNT